MTVKQEGVTSVHPRGNKCSPDALQVVAAVLPWGAADSEAG